MNSRQLLLTFWPELAVSQVDSTARLVIVPDTTVIGRIAPTRFLLSDVSPFVSHIGFWDLYFT